MMVRMQAGDICYSENKRKEQTSLMVRVLILIVHCRIDWLVCFVLFHQNMYHRSFRVGKRLEDLVQNYKLFPSGLCHQRN